MSASPPQVFFTSFLGTAALQALQDEATESYSHHNAKDIGGDVLEDVARRAPIPYSYFLNRVRKPRADSRSTSPSFLESRIPVELQFMIFELLDVSSLHMLSRTSRNMYQLAMSLPIYELLTKTHRPVLYRLQSLSMLAWYTIGTLQSALRSAACGKCGALAPLLNLSCCERSCVSCWLVSRRKGIRYEFYPPWSLGKTQRDMIVDVWGLKRTDWPDFYPDSVQRWWVKKGTWNELKGRERSWLIPPE